MPNRIDLDNHEALNLVEMVFNYVLSNSSAKDIAQFIEDSHQLPQPIRGELMTIAELLEAKGRDEGAEANSKKIAVNLLKEGLESEFVARTAEIDLTTVIELKMQLDNKE